MKDTLPFIDRVVLFNLYPVLRISLNNRNIISFLVICTPFTLGESPILNINSIYLSWVGIIILFCLNFDRIIIHKRILKNNYSIPLILFASSFFFSVMFGAEYTNNQYISTSDFSYSHTFQWVAAFITTQSILIYLIYISVDDFSDIVYFINAFIISGVIVNLLAIYTMLVGIFGADGRLLSTFKDPNYLGRFELFIIVISLCILIHTKNSIFNKIFYVINILVSMFIMYFTFSRAALITLPLIIVILILFKRSKIIKLTSVVGISLVFSTLLISAASRRLGESNLGLIGSLIDTSNIMRIVANYIGFMFFLDYPFFGIGYHNYYYTFLQSKYFNPLTANMEFIHSWFFSLMAEQGLFGVLTFLWILFLIYKSLIKYIKVDKLRNFKWIGILWLCLLTTLLLNGMFFPSFFPELNFALFCGIIGAYFKESAKVTNIMKE